MWSDSSELLATFDTVVFIFALFALLPLLIRRFWLIVLYLSVNALIAFFFVISFKNTFQLSSFEVRDFITDAFFAMLIIAFGSYSVFVINERILKRSIADSKDRSEAEEALLVSERRFSDLTNLLPQPVYETDQSGRLIYANANAFQSFGYNSNDLLEGIKMSDMIIPEDRELLKIFQIFLMANHRLAISIQD